jgi:hypothetical protein
VRGPAVRGPAKPVTGGPEGPAAAQHGLRCGGLAVRGTPGQVAGPRPAGSCCPATSSLHPGDVAARATAAPAPPGAAEFSWPRARRLRGEVSRCLNRCPPGRDRDPRDLESNAWPLNSACPGRQAAGPGAPGLRVHCRAGPRRGRASDSEQ